MSARNVGKLPVFDDCNFVGILTSGDLPNILHIAENYSKTATIS
jgi:hypothetical protein